MVMISIIKGRMTCTCAICRRDIESGIMKIKDSQDNSNRKYYHLGCCPRTVIDRNLGLWTLARQESQRLEETS